MLMCSMFSLRCLLAGVGCTLFSYIAQGCKGWVCKLSGALLVHSSSSLWAATTGTQTATWCRPALAWPRLACLTPQECPQPPQVSVLLLFWLP
jgi:hypothetical protein